MRPTTPAKGPAAFTTRRVAISPKRRLDRAHALRVLADPRHPGVQQEARRAALGEAVRRRMAGELAVALAEGGGHGPFRDVGEAGANLGRGQELRIGHPQCVMLDDCRLQAVHLARLIRDEEIARVAQRDIVVRDADDLGEVLVDADALLGQLGHRRLGELQPERLDGLGRTSGCPDRSASPAARCPVRRVESQKAVATPTIPPPITTASAVAGQVSAVGVKIVTHEAPPQHGESGRLVVSRS